MQFKKFSDGTKVPIIGIGTWRMYGEECYKAVKTALKLGYTHIDKSNKANA